VIVAYTEADEIITSGLAIRAVRNMSIDTSVKADSVVNNTNESRSKLEQVAVKASENALPAYFKVSDTAYLGLDKKKSVYA
jgi:uncharacterized protein YfdQ (DUF2303 family)